jgi:hypothetical protein
MASAGGCLQPSRVFITERDGPMRPKAFHALFGRLGARAGMAFPIHPHMLRHGCGYALANAGHDTRALQGMGTRTFSIRCVTPSWRRTGLGTSGGDRGGQFGRYLRKTAREIFLASTDRPELARAICRLEAGDVLVVTRLDRRARSTRDLLQSPRSAPALSPSRTLGPRRSR